MKRLNERITEKRRRSWNVFHEMTWVLQSYIKASRTLSKWVPACRWVSTWGHCHSFDLWTQFCPVQFSRDLSGQVETLLLSMNYSTHAPLLYSRLTALVDFNWTLHHSQRPAPQRLSAVVRRDDLEALSIIGHLWHHHYWDTPTKLLLLYHIWCTHCELYHVVIFNLT